MHWFSLIETYIGEEFGEKVNALRHSLSGCEGGAWWTFDTVQSFPTAMFQNDSVQQLDFLIAPSTAHCVPIKCLASTTTTYLGAPESPVVLYGQAQRFRSLQLSRS
eukprot:5932702-Amphidinium_carterae.1